jgi:hypothetical protein
LAIINKYGFKFNGATSIKAYTNPTLKPYDTFLYLDFKYKYVSDGDPTDGASIIPGNTSDTYNEGLRLRTVKVGIEHRLYYTFSFGDSFSSPLQYSIINDGDEVSFCMNVYSDATDTYVDFWLNGINVNTSDISKRLGNIEQWDLSRFDIGNDIPGGNSGKTYSTLSNLALWNFSKTTQEITDLFDNFDSTDAVFIETFDQTTKGAISGTEQYEVIDSYERVGILLEKKDSWLETTNGFSKVIEEYFYGGEISFSWDNPGVTSVQLLGYDEKLKSARILATSNNPASNSVTFNIGEVAVRRMKVIIESSSTIGNVSYLIAHLFDIWTNTENTPTNARIIDNDVFYNSITLNNKAVSFRVPDEKTNIAKNLLQNKVYLDDVEYQIAGLNAIEFDINNWAYNANFIEVLNG